MKTSNKLLIGFFVLILLAITLFFLSVRANLNQEAPSGNLNKKLQSRQVEVIGNRQ